MAVILLRPFLLCLCWRCRGGSSWIVMVEPFGLGDALSLSVMLDPLRRVRPQHRICLLLKTENESLYAGDPRVARVLTAPFPWSRLSGDKHGTLRDWWRVGQAVAQVRALRPEIGLDTRGEIRSQILLVLCGCRERIGFHNYLNSNLNVHGWLLTRRVSKPPVLHRYEINRLLLKDGLGIDIGALSFPTYFPPRGRGGDPSETDKPSPASSLVLVHPGARWIYRRWPTEYWVAALDQLMEEKGVQIRLVGMPAEEYLLREIAGACRRPPDVRMTSLADLAQWIQEAALLICLDSGPMHMAVTMGIPVLALFGPGDADLWRPLGLHARFLQVKYSCNPCLQKVCVVPHDSCMMKILPEQVIAAAGELLRRNLNLNPETEK
ncbi:MAG: glycosyltransferase family 9 protein [Kiritimatiellaeota bacterium]|nr:glycosyltransferase family 9 protein [Kiritimatiellota bacterium]